ncbi:hypothetical protein CG471_29170, partial [Sphingobium sp. IP1]
LYRVPVTVDVAAKGQKQVALLRQPDVLVERLYAATLDYRDGNGGSRPMTLRLRLQNRKADGLGLAMPSGRVALFETIDGQRLLAGETDIGDKAEGERVDYDIAQSADVRIMAVIGGQSAKARRWTLTLTNARPFDATAEILIPHDIAPRPTQMERRGNSWVWRAIIPANGQVSYSYDQKLR